MVQNIAEKFNPLSRVLRHRQQTIDRRMCRVRWHKTNVA